MAILNSRFASSAAYFAGVTQMKVVHNFVCRDTIAVLKWLLQRALAGDLLGIAISVRLRSGEHVLFTGSYRIRRRNAICASIEMFHAASAMHDELPPPFHTWASK